MLADCYSRADVDEFGVGKPIQVRHLLRVLVRARADGVEKSVLAEVAGEKPRRDSSHCENEEVGTSITTMGNNNNNNNNNNSSSSNNNNKNIPPAEAKARQRVHLAPSSQQPWMVTKVNQETGERDIKTRRRDSVEKEKRKE